MAKTAKLKNRSNTSSLANPRSRLSRRRATSPSTDTPKSLSSVSRAADATPALAPPPPHLDRRKNQAAPATADGGITKKRPRRKRPPTRQQRLRQEKGLARAEDVLGKMERKVEGSVRKGRLGRERRRGWEEVNGKGGGNRSTRTDPGGGLEATGQGNGDEMEVEVEDEREDGPLDVEEGTEMMGREEKGTEELSGEPKVMGPDAVTADPDNEEDKIT